MALSNKDLSRTTQVFVSQTEAGISNTVPAYRSPQNKTSYIKKIILTNNTSSSASVDIGLYENTFMPGGNVFSIGGNGNSDVAISTNGITWTTGTMPSSFSGLFSAYGNGVFVRYSGSTTTAAYSADGLNWTVTTLPGSLSWGSVTYGNGIFLMAAGSSTTMAASTDGITWSVRTAPTIFSTVPSYRLTYGNGLFVLYASNDNLFFSSTDAVTWTRISINAPSTAMGVLKFLNNIWIYAQFTGGNPDPVRIGGISSDLVNWRSITIGSNSSAFGFYDILFGNGTFLTWLSTTTSAYSSTNGINWTVRTLPSNRADILGAYGNGRFVLTGKTTVYSSTDAITWTETTGIGGTYTAIAYPQNSDFTNNTYLYKSLSVSENTTQSISYEVVVPPTHEIRVRSSVPVQVTVMGEA